MRYEYVCVRGFSAFKNIFFKKCRKNLHIKINCCTFAADCHGPTCYSYCKIGHDIECTNVLNKDLDQDERLIPKRKKDCKPSSLSKKQANPDQPVLCIIVS